MNARRVAVILGIALVLAPAASWALSVPRPSGPGYAAQAGGMGGMPSMPAGQPPGATPEAAQTTPFPGEWIFWVNSILAHIRMMYWVWIPGLLFASVLAIRYGLSSAADVTPPAPSSLVTRLLARIGKGMVGSVSRARAIGVAARFLLEGHPVEALAWLVTTQTIVVYHLVVLLFFFGIEFVLGQLAGALVMIVLLGLGMRFVLPPTPAATQGVVTDVSATAVDGSRIPQARSWKDVLLTRRGWKAAFRYLASETAGMLIPLAVGILIGAALLAAGRRGWDPQVAALLRGEGPLADVVSALIGPLLAMLIPVPPVGNLVAADGFWKLFAVEYPGLLGFTLASVLNPLLWSAYARLWGKRNAWRLLLVLYTAIVLSSLVVAGLFDLFGGHRPGHAPWFRTLVDTIMNAMPFAMPSMAPMK